MAKEPKEKKPNAVSFAIAGLRRASYRWPARSQAKSAARQDRGVYVCAVCEGFFGPREVQVDHIDPVVPLTGWDSFDGFITRLFCPVEKLSVLCKPCHSAKTKLENKIRRENKKK